MHGGFAEGREDAVDVLLDVAVVDRFVGHQAAVDDRSCERFDQVAGIDAVREFAALLRDFGGVETGDPTTFHSPKPFVVEGCRVELKKSGRSFTTASSITSGCSRR